MPTMIMGGLVRTALVLLAGLIIIPAAAQFNGSDNYIFISGQLNNNVNGAPIADHDIYIISDTTGGSFEHYSIVKTDINGFFRDTAITTQTDGAMVIYLHDFLGMLREDTLYYRFTFSDDYHMICNFEIYDPNATQTLQANFRAEEDTVSGNALSVIFRDMTFGYKVKSWQWDFGDGTSSTVQDPNHIYTEPGIYMVRLTVSAYPSAYEYFQSSTIMKQVEVGRANEYHLGGHVFTGLYPPIDVGYAYLYMITEEDEYIPLDTTVIDTLGFYYFFQLLEGKYTVKTRLDESSYFYGQYIPTYYGNVLAWDQAQRIMLDQTNWECHINLIGSDGIPFGKGQIVGHMMYDTVTAKNPLVPAGNVEVVLLGAQGNHITCNVSGLDGTFVFSELAYGTYQLFPDVAGIPVSPVFVTITEDSPTADGFSLVISGPDISYLGLNEPDAAIEAVGSLYPNPARDQVSLSLEADRSATIEVMVIDPAGRCVMSMTDALRQGKHTLPLDLESLRAGFYQVFVISEGKACFASKLVILE